jgi:hypothetical protein
MYNVMYISVALAKAVQLPSAVVVMYVTLVTV